MTSTAYAAGPVGFLVVGPVVDSAGVGAAFLAAAGLLVVLAVGSALSPSLRGLDRKVLPGDREISREA